MEVVWRGEDKYCQAIIARLEGGKQFFTNECEPMRKGCMEEREDGNTAHFPNPKWIIDSVIENVIWFVVRRI